MILKEKQLLLKDLSQRVSSGVCIFFEKTCGVFTLCGVKVYSMFPENDILVLLNDKYPIQWCKPYLRPMSSMTDNEQDELDNIRLGNYGEDVDWLNKNMFDYRGLIPMGLALEALEGMYKTK